jgi:hypothetical protein
MGVISAFLTVKIRADPRPRLISTVLTLEAPKSPSSGPVSRLLASRRRSHCLQNEACSVVLVVPESDPWRVFQLT